MGSPERGRITRWSRVESAVVITARVSPATVRDARDRPPARACSAARSGVERARCAAGQLESSAVSVPASARPAVKYGAIRLSNIVSAEPIAMCMSRYL